MTPSRMPPERSELPQDGRSPEERALSLPILANLAFRIAMWRYFPGKIFSRVGRAYKRAPVGPLKG
jgi:hypothetical protein